ATPRPNDQPLQWDSTGYYYLTASQMQSPHFWVSATGGSLNVNDIRFTFTDSNAAANGVPPWAAYTMSAQSNPATAVSIRLLSANNPNPNDPNNGDTATVRNGKTRAWLVGQMVDMHVDVQAPVAWRRQM